MHKQPDTAAIKPYMFKKGQSGNPGGRHKSVRVCRDLARAMTPEAMERLHELMAQNIDKPTALAATKEILLRGVGKHLDPDQLYPGKSADRNLLPIAAKDLSDSQLDRILGIMREGLP